MLKIEGDHVQRAYCKKLVLSHCEAETQVGSDRLSLRLSINDYIIRTIYSSDVKWLFLTGRARS